MSTKNEIDQYNDVLTKEEIDAILVELDIILDRKEVCINADD